MAGRLAWIMGNPSGALDIHGSTEDGLDREQVADEAIRFITLAVLYWQHARNPEREAIPRVTADPMRKLPRKKARAKLKKHSLFTIQRLASPPDRFGREEADRREGGWCLDHRVRVRGHFKLQPYGPNQAYRRLQWIAPHYRGPEDQPERIPMDRLKSGFADGSG